jgi:replicative DNA helicase
MEGSMKDENDRAVDGTLPDDPGKGCSPANNAAEQREESRVRVLTVQKVLQQAFTDSLDRQSGKRRPCTSGSRQLDAITGGIQPGHTWVFGAETNWGKSSWLTALADENLAVHTKVAIVSAEDDEGIYGSRLLSRRTGVPLTNIVRGQLDREAHRLIADCVVRGEDQPFYVDARGRRIEDVEKEVERLILEEGVQLVAWDYLQEFSSKRRYQDERVKYKEIAAVMRGVTKRHRVGGIILSQITIQTGKTYPDKHSIRECRDVSNAAEVVALGFTLVEDTTVRRLDRDEQFQKGDHCVLIDKNKTGPKPVLVRMKWDRDVATFVSDVRDPEIDELDDFSEDAEVWHP